MQKLNLGHASQYSVDDALEMLRTAAAVLEYSEHPDLAETAYNIQHDPIKDVESYIESNLVAIGDPYKDVR